MLKTLTLFLFGLLFVAQSVHAQCDAEVTIEVSPDAPNNVFCPYDTAKLTVISDFTAYQWYYSFSNTNQGGAPIDGATGQTLQVPLADWGFAYFYVEAVYDDTCRTPSDPVVIDSWVFSFPAIQHDFDTDLCNGDSAFIQNAFGVYQAYQWYRDGSPIPGADQDGYWVTEPGTYVLETNPAECPLLTLSSGVGPTFTFSGPARPVITESNGVLEAGSGPFHQWAYEGMNIPGATAATYAPSETGNYTVTAIDANGCAATSDPYFFTTTAVEGPGQEQAIRFFPNPVDQWLYVESPGIEDYRLEILDVAGRAVFAAEGAGGASEAFNLEHLRPGWYVLRWRSGETMLDRKLLLR